MTYWEPISTPASHLEPPDPEEWICPTCEQDSQDCACGNCEACGERAEVHKYKIEDDEAWLCDTCQGVPA